MYLVHLAGPCQVFLSFTYSLIMYKIGNNAYNIRKKTKCRKTTNYVHPRIPIELNIDI